MTEGIDSMDRKWDVGTKLIPGLYAVLACMVAILLLIVARTENVLVFETRGEPERCAVNNAAFQEIEDDSAPAGVRQRYSWTLPKQIEEGCCLAFYTVHQRTAVYVDGELLYSLTSQPDNQIGRTVGSDWNTVPLYPGDAGKEVRVEITPIYESSKSRMVTFYTGSRFQIYMNQVEKDFPQIVLSILTIMVGLGFIVRVLYNRFTWKGRYDGDYLYLAVFAVIIGLWKLSDTRSSPLLFPRNPMFLSYFTLAMLLLAPVPMLMFARGCSSGRSSRFLDDVCMLSLLSGVAIVILQAANVLDFRESLPATHVVIGLTMAVVLLSTVREWKRRGKNLRLLITMFGLLICVVGALLDLTFFYVQGNSAHILYTLAAFLVYVILMGMASGREMNQRAYVDMHTGLYNKNSCNERQGGYGPVQEPTAVFMFDLNGLKQINDTLGHGAGDTLIFQFADILRKNLPVKAFVGRYGGDEFIAILSPADSAAVHRALTDVADAVDWYNKGEGRVPIGYAVGSALSTDYPGESLRALLDRADIDMYQDKHLKYAGVHGGV